MKKTFFFFACMFICILTSFASSPNEKVLRSFQSTFARPSEVKWFDHPDHFEVSFVQSEVRSTVKYDLEGDFMSSIRYYKEEHLPTNILCKLKKKFADKNIYGVTEVTNNEEINYYVKLEDGKRWFTVKVNGNGQTEVLEKFRKA